MLPVASSMSTNTQVAPRSATAVAGDGNVKLGTITSSPGRKSSSSVASSSAWVHDVVSRACGDSVIGLSFAVAARVKAAVAVHVTGGEHLRDILELTRSAKRAC